MSHNLWLRKSKLLSGAIFYPIFNFAPTLPMTSPSTSYHFKFLISIAFEIISLRRGEFQKRYWQYRIALDLKTISLRLGSFWCPGVYGFYLSEVCTNGVYVKSITKYPTFQTQKSFIIKELEANIGPGSILVGWIRWAHPHFAISFWDIFTKTSYWPRLESYTYVTYRMSKLDLSPRCVWS